MAKNTRRQEEVRKVDGLSRCLTRARWEVFDLLVSAGVKQYGAYHACYFGRTKVLGWGRQLKKLKGKARREFATNVVNSLFGGAR